MPRAVRQRRSGIQSGDPPAISPVNNEYAVVDGYFSSRIFRKVHIVEVKRIQVVENDNHRTACAAHLHVESKAAGLYTFQPCKLQWAARNTRRPGAFHMEIRKVSLCESFPVFGKGYLPGIQAA